MISPLVWITFTLQFLLSTLEIAMDGLERTNLGYSTKNIPAPAKKDYLKCLIAKAETFMRNVRLRTFFFLNPDTTTKRKQTYGFKSTKSPPYILELKQFEDGMLDIVQNIEFTKPGNTIPFQKQLSIDAKDINTDDKLYVAADKTTNFYKVKPEDYNKLLEKSITKDYTLATTSSEKQITIEDKNIASKLDLDDRIDTTAKSQTFITLKDHEPNFSNNPSCRPINPCKSEIGKN